MPRFVSVKDGYVNVEHIRRIEAAAEGSILHLTDGRTAVAPQVSPYDPYQLNSEIVPAHPGYQLLYCDPEKWLKEGAEYRSLIWSEAIIAWAIDPDGEHIGNAITPITPAGMIQASNMDAWLAILQPDGKVIGLGEGKWESVDAWLEEVKSERASHKLKVVT